MIELKKIKKNRAGMTLMEVLVVMAIFSIVMVGINMLFVKSWKNYKLVLNTSTASIAANKGVSDVINTLRKARISDEGKYPIVSTSSFDLKIYSDIDRDAVTERVHYYLNGTDLMVGISDPSGFPPTYPTEDTETKLIINNVVNDSSQPLFFYYDEKNDLINSPADNLNIIRMIEINLFIKRNEGDINIESYASLRNLNKHNTAE